VNCRFVEIEAQKKLSWAWVVGDIDTVVTFTLTPTASGTPPVPRAVRLQAGPEAELRRRALRLEDDGRKARRSAREDPMSDSGSSSEEVSMNWNEWTALSRFSAFV